MDLDRVKGAERGVFSLKGHPNGPTAAGDILFRTKLDLALC